MTRTTRIWMWIFAVFVVLPGTGCTGRADRDDASHRQGEAAHDDHREGERDEHGHGEHGDEGVVELGP